MPVLAQSIYALVTMAGTALMVGIGVQNGNEYGGSGLAIEPEGLARESSTAHAFGPTHLARESSKATGGSVARINSLIDERTEYLRRDIRPSGPLLQRTAGPGQQGWYREQAGPGQQGWYREQAGPGQQGWYREQAGPGQQGWYREQAGPGQQGWYNENAKTQNGEDGTSSDQEANNRRGGAATDDNESFIKDTATGAAIGAATGAAIGIGTGSDDIIDDLIEGAVVGGAFGIFF